VAKNDRPFIKSADTSTSAVNSRSELDKMLRRYGASTISMSENVEEGQIVVSFIVPDTLQKGATKVPVKLPISIRNVYHVLYGKPTRYSWDAELKRSSTVYDPKGYDSKKWAQAERVAWRNLVLWVDAALSAATAGLQTITEAFFAHAVVGEGGTRMVEIVEAFQSQLGTGVQRLLTAPAEVIE
jgi:hypothetical protein